MISASPDGVDPPRALPLLSVTDRLVLLAAEGFGLGRIPVAPGTFGSLWAFPIGWLFILVALPTWACGLVWLAMFVAGIPLCDRAARRRSCKDPGSVVWDEMTAFPLIFTLVPMTASTVALSFVCFRFFDIAKPWPVRRLEHLPGGLGIMADDQMAGLYAAAMVKLATLVFSIAT